MLYVLLLGHFIGDFLLQNNRLVKYKNKNSLGVLLHLLIVFVVYLLIIWAFVDDFVDVSLFEIFIQSFILTLAHFVIDVLKYILIKTKFGKSRDMCIFLLDQALHILSILLIYDYIYSINLNETITLQLHIIIILMLWIAVVFTGDVFIKKFFSNFYKKPIEHKEDVTGIGSVIGKIERSIIFLLLVLSGSVSGLVAVIGVKSLARFKEYKESNIDYYIVGTLLSLLIVVVGYFIYYVIMGNTIIKNYVMY